MKYTVKFSTEFKRSFKKCMKRGLDEKKFKKVVLLLAENGQLPSQYRPHKLVGKYTGLWECHIQPDWLLIWEQKDSELILILVDTVEDEHYCCLDDCYAPDFLV